MEREVGHLYSKDCYAKNKNLIRYLHFVAIFLILLMSGCFRNKNLDNIRPVTEVENHKVFSTDYFDSSPYVINEGDLLSINVYRRSDLSSMLQLDNIRIMQNGEISIPLVGEIKAAGMTISELRTKITEGLSGYYVSPVVNVNVTYSSGQNVYVLGEVKNPGNYDISGKITAIEAILMAGGFTKDADMAKIILLRTDQKTKGHSKDKHLTALDIKNFLEKADLRENVVLQKKDVLYIPPDHISRSNRFFTYVHNIIRPLSDIVGTVANIIILKGATD